MKRWVTIYPPMINVELIKHVGQFPLVAHVVGGFKSKIVCYDNEELSLINEIPGVMIEHIKNSGDEIGDVIRYIVDNARRIDVLHMFHIKMKTLLPILVYKILNPRGKVWLDTDTNMPWLNTYENKKTGDFSEKTEHLLETFVMRKCTLISSPSSMCSERLMKIWILPVDKVHYIPLGFLKSNKEYNIVEKEKTFICVGRLGEKQKNVELLVNAFCQTMCQHEWKLILIGTSTDEFRKYLEDKIKFYQAQDRIIYKGEIYDRDDLYKEYAKASVFVLPSRFESFGIVLCEAMAQGCYILESDGNPAHKDIVANERIGASFKNNRLSDLKEKLLSVIDSEHLSADGIMYRCRYSEKFTYPVIFDDLKKYLV